MCRHTRGSVRCRYGGSSTQSGCDGFRVVETHPRPSFVNRSLQPGVRQGSAAKGAGHRDGGPQQSCLAELHIAIASDAPGKPPELGNGSGIAWNPCYRDTMILSFTNRGTEDIFNGRNTSAACRTCPPRLWAVAARKLDQLDSAFAPGDLRAPPGSRPEALSGDREGQHSIRIDDRYRICFVWTDSGVEQVEILDYH